MERNYDRVAFCGSGENIRKYVSIKRYLIENNAISRNLDYDLDNTDHLRMSKNTLTDSPTPPFSLNAI